MKFTIRDLLWLTVVVALGVAWWVDRGRLLQKIDELDGPNTIVEFLSLKLEDGNALPHTDPVLPNPSAPAKNLPSD